MGAASNAFNFFKAAQAAALAGKKVAYGVVEWDGAAWNVLNNADHQSLNADSVSVDANGLITVDYTSAGITKVGTFLHSLDKDLTALGVSIGGSYGASDALLNMYVGKTQNALIRCEYDSVGGSWIVSQAAGSLAAAPALLSWNPVTGVLRVTHNNAQMRAYGMQLCNNAGVPAARAVYTQLSYGTGETNLTLQALPGLGAYGPVAGDNLYFQLSDRTGASGAGSIFTSAVAQEQVTLLDMQNDFPASGGGAFTNFQFLIIGE